VTEEKEEARRGRGSISTASTAPKMLREILPKCGLVYSEKGNLSEVSFVVNHIISPGTGCIGTP